MTITDEDPHSDRRLTIIRLIHLNNEFVNYNPYNTLNPEAKKNALTLLISDTYPNYRFLFPGLARIGITTQLENR